MKRFLSLVLTLVMVMSLVTVSAGAKDFTDDDSITYDEAVAVISEIGVVDGDTNGAFRPTDTLTRQAAAKIICNLILGPTTASELHADTAPYRDVPVNNQFAGYIAYCQAKGIISGYADGSFRPTGTLTGYAFMKMLLGALGYDSSLENYVGNNWSINVAKQALHIKLNKGLEAKDGAEFNGIKAVTREEAALYAFNTLQADLVEYGQRLTTNVNGTEVTLSSGGAKSREWNSQQTRYNTIRDDNLVQFAEEYFNKLVKTPDEDIFMRPAHTWVYDKQIQIGTWTDMDKLLETYTTGASGRDLYDLLGSATIRDYDLEVYVDGHEAGRGTNYVQQYGTNYGERVNNVWTAGANELITSAELRRANTSDLGATGDGVLTEVFKDDDAETIRIVSIHTWLAQATSAYNETREAAILKVFLTLGAGGVGSFSKTVNVEDVAEAADVTVDDFYLVQMSDKDTTALEVAVIDEPEILEQSTVTKFSTVNEEDRNYPSKLTTGGTDYNRSDRAVYDEETLDLYNADLLAINTYNVYVDKYGYFIGVDLFEGAKQYVFVTGYDMRNSNLTVRTAEAAGIFLDGTMETMTVNVKDTNKNILSMVYENDDWDDPKADGVDGRNAAAYYQQWAANQSQGVYLLNRWYTYTKTDAGVYTLKPCVNKDGVAMMLASKTAETGDEDAQTLKMNCSRLRLDSVTDTYYTDATDNNVVGDLLQGETMQYTDGTGSGVNQTLTSVRAYGEDESVFITVDVDEEVSAVLGGTGVDRLEITKAITDVNGVYTGVQDVDLITSTKNRIQGWYFANNTGAGSVVGQRATYGNDFYNNATDENGHFVRVDNTITTGESYLGENAYAVFDKDHFIIGAVILGEAEGNAATKAWIIDPVKYERYENGTYYWQFEAVINGEIVTQEAESKYIDVIDRMRDNRYEIVELRYKDADNEIVTDVKEMERTDTNADLDRADDNIWGNPFGEVLTTGHKVKDNESVYDVVLTGPEGHADDLDANTADNNVTFRYVTRPRTTTPSEGHAAGGKTFVETSIGTLRLQGRTLYVIDGQHDYGIDFTREAKAVVYQPENGKMEKRAYSTVQEAIDSLGDAIVDNGDTKEYRGIISAALNGQQVAEWVVFYSDTNVETLNDVNIGQATMDVRIDVLLPESSAAETYGVIQVARPASGRIANVPNPTDYATSRGWGDPYPGYVPEKKVMTVTWSKDYETMPVVTFRYMLATTAEDKADVEAAADVVELPTNDNLLVEPATTTERAARAAIEAKVKTLTFVDSEGNAVAISTLDSVEAVITDFTAPSAATRGRAVANITLKKGNATETINGVTFRLEKVVGESGTSVEDVTPETGTDDAGVKGKDSGAYIFTDANAIKPGDIHGDATDNMFFVYKAVAANASSATLRIYDETGTVMYTETATFAANTAGGGHYFYVQVVGDCANAGSGPMKTQGLPAGEYTWTITGTNIDEPTGSFTIA